VETVIEFDSVTKRFRETVAVNELSFTVGAGTVVGFLGPNGAGKTTALRMLLGLLAPTAGRAVIDGRRYAELRDPARTVGALLETAQFHPGRTGRNHLRVLARAAGVGERRVRELLRLVELEAVADRRVRGYSLGMRQRLGLAAALLGDPRVLVLDEPANGLDPQGIRWLRDFLGDRRAAGCTVLISTHALAEVVQFVDHIVVLAAGRLVGQGRLDDLTRGQSLEDLFLSLTEGGKG
jgi:ABC-2 type transport system ATP-binding protein